MAVLPHALLVSLFILFSLSGCKISEGESFENRFGVPDSSFIPDYAKGFSIHYFNHDKVIEITDPFNNDEQSSYFLINYDGEPSFENVEIIDAPIKSWSAFSSTQVVMAEKLELISTLTSVAEPQYISGEEVNRRLESGDIRDVGMAFSPDIEVLLLTEPQFVFVSPFKDTQYDNLKDAGLTVIPDAGYLESNPLGRVEWLVFFGAFFDKEQKALDIYNSVKSQYQKMTLLTQGIQRKPTVTAGLLYQDVWYLPAGDSFMARLLEDAGVSYPYYSTKGTGSLAYDYEKVFNDTYDCQFWIVTVNHPGEFNYKALKGMDERYSDFYAYKNRNIIYTNTDYSGFFEYGWLQPHIVLMDFIKIFHPDLLPDHKLKYYRMLP
ncbi:ABC transporter substrate-binding protein [Marinilabiliaceae bacterium ANBcel2]|nr:ABC transporter substrate-binding protein [Marinilabiliaceae bacterium ANBcel2]